jgi:hypothetical protein
MRKRCLSAGLVAVLTGLALQISTASAQHPFATLRLAQIRTFRSANLPPGKTLACIGHGKRITATVPPHGRIPPLPSTFQLTSPSTLELKPGFHGLHLQIQSAGHGTILLVTCL